MIYGFPHFPLLVAWVGLVGSTTNLGPSDYLIIVGALGFAWASLRNGRMKVLRDTNKDLLVRNELLEREAVKDAAELKALRAKPDLDAMSIVINRLLDRNENHDRNEALIWNEMVHTLSEIRSAVERRQ